MSRTLHQHLTQKPTDALAPGERDPKRILALDGGGVKGVLTLGMLKSLESELRKRSGDPNLVLSDYYDLIGGTSTGAIIACGLALGKSVDFLIDMYLELGPKVFREARAAGFLRAKYDQGHLREALEPVIGRRTLGTDDLRTGFALHAKRVDTGSAWVLTNHPKGKFFDPPADNTTIPNKKYKLIELVMASAAAPTFFDEVKFKIADGEGDIPAQFGYFVDGAVSANNNPSMSLLMLALEPAYKFGWRGGAQELLMTSVGTGMRRPEIEGEKFEGQSVALKAVHALRTMIYDTQVQGIMLMQALSEPQRPWRINSEVGDMRGTSIAGEHLLDYQRIDVVLDRKPKRERGRPINRTPIEEMLGLDLTAKQMESLDELANGTPKNMNLLLDIGLAVGPNFVDEQYPPRNFDLPEWKGRA